MCRTATPPRCRLFNRAFLRELARAPQPSPWPAHIELEVVAHDASSLWLALALAWLFRKDARLTCFAKCRAHALASQLREEALRALRQQGATPPDGWQHHDYLRAHAALHHGVVALVRLDLPAMPTVVFTPPGRAQFVQPAVLLGTRGGCRFDVLSCTEVAQEPLSLQFNLGVHRRVDLEATDARA